MPWTDNQGFHRAWIIQLIFGPDIASKGFYSLLGGAAALTGEPEVGWKNVALGEDGH